MGVRHVLYYVGGFVMLPESCSPPWRAPTRPLLAVRLPILR